MRKLFARGRRTVEAMFFVGAALVIGSLLWRYQLLHEFLSHPGQPVETTGETVPYVLDGRTVYITGGQHLASTLVVIAQVTGFLLFALFVWLSRHRGR
jgi:hypothetical protein